MTEDEGDDNEEDVRKVHYNEREEEEEEVDLREYEEEVRADIHCSVAKLCPMSASGSSI